MIPDKLKQHAVDLHNIVSLIYTGYPPDDVKYAYVSMKQVKRLIWLEKKLQTFMSEELGSFWESEFIFSKKKNKEDES